MSVRPILVTLDKAEVTGALVDGVFSSVVSLDIPGMQNGTTKDYCIKQITVTSEDAPTSWYIAIFNDAAGGDVADLDSDSLASVEAITKPVTTSPTTLDYYSVSDLEIYCKATPTGTQDSSPHLNDTQPMQIHVAIAPNGAAKTAGATGEVTVKIWILPILGFVS